MIQSRNLRTVQIPGMEVIFALEDIEREVAWEIRAAWHVAIIHLGGRMDLLETELDGHGGSTGAALAGEVWTVPAGRTYSGRSRGGHIRYAELWISPEVIDRIAPLAGVHDERLRREVERLAEVSEALEIEDAALGLLASARRSLGGVPPEVSGTGLAPAVARKVRGEIHGRLGEELSLAYLAEVAGMGCHRFLASFRATFGSSPWQYVIRARLRAAGRMLETTDLDITRIALETGFASHSHLTTAFGRHFGQTPGGYRKRCHDTLERGGISCP